MEGGRREGARVVSRKVVPREVKHARAFGGGSAAGDHARGGLEFKTFRGGPQLEGSNARGAGNVGGGPRGGVEIEVSDKDGGNVRGKGETEEGLEGRRVVNVVVEGDNT